VGERGVGGKFRIRSQGRSRRAATTVEVVDRGTVNRDGVNRSCRPAAIVMQRGYDFAEGVDAPHSERLRGDDHQALGTNAEACFHGAKCKLVWM